MKDKVILVLPNTRWHGKREWLSMPFSALLLTDILKRDFEFNILDANGLDLSEEECALKITEYGPKIVLISALSVEYHRQFHTALAIAKNVCPRAITVIGGVYPTVLGEEVLKDPNADYIFLGHAEERAVNFLNLIILDDKNAVSEFPGIGFKESDGGIRINPVNTYISDVKVMAKPDYSLLDIAPYLEKKVINGKDIITASLISSYGCPYNCLFCATRTISGRGVAYRPVEDVLAEINFLQNDYGVNNLLFMDDCLLADKKRITVLLKNLLANKKNLTWRAATVSAWDLDDKLMELMKESGCTDIYLAIESGSPRVLHKIIRKPLKLEIIPPIVKKCKELGIDVAANFIIGFPGETWQDIRTSVQFAQECDFDLVHFHIATPLPKTDLYKVAKQQGVLPDDFNFFDSKYVGFSRGFITTDEFTPQELMVLRAYEWDRINCKTPEKTAKVADMYKISMAELNELRKKTRQKQGVIF